MMKHILFLALILISCGQNDTTQNPNKKTSENKDSLKPTDTIQESNLSSLLDEQKHLVELTEKYNETGNSKYLQGVLEHWQAGLKDEYIATYTPLYCGLVCELMGNRDKALSYYEQAKQLGVERKSKPLDDIEYEFGVNSEDELIKMFKATDRKFDIEVFKEKKITYQKYWLYLSQIALGENKFKEFNNLNIDEMFMSFVSTDLKINKREDIFQLIKGWDQ